MPTTVLRQEKRRQVRFCFAVFISVLFGSPGYAQSSQQIPSMYIGIWAEHCETTTGPRIQIEADRVTVDHRGKQYAYNGAEFSNTFGEGAHASGRKGWILVSKVPNGMYAFVMTVPGAGRTGPLMVEEGAENEGGEIRDLYKARFRKCH